MSGSSELLFLTPVAPDARGNGLAMRAGLFLQGLARCRPVRVLVVPVAGETPTATELVRRHAAGFAVLPLDHAADPRHAVMERLSTPAGRRRAEALHPLPALCRTATPALAEAVAEAAAGCEAVHVMRLYLAPFLDALLDSPGRPRLVLDLDDIDSAVQRSLGDDEQASRYERLEAYYLPQLDHLITCSEADARMVAERHGATAVVPVPNAVRPPGASSAPDRHDLLFVGNLSYAPNVDAACWLCREVMPLMAGATLAIVGSRPTSAVRALARDGITVAPDVPDVGPWYAGSRVAVAPLRAGGGTRIKVLEAFAHRRPVVATSRGAEGLDLADEGGPVVVADSPAEFAAACRRLLDDPDEAARLAARGEAIVRESATLDVGAASIERLFRNILAAP